MFICHELPKRGEKGELAAGLAGAFVCCVCVQNKIESRTRKTACVARCVEWCGIGQRPHCVGRWSPRATAAI